LSTKTITINKKAGFEYHLTDKYEAGIVLKGSEVKSIREGKVNDKDILAAFNKWGCKNFNISYNPIF